MKRVMVIGCCGAGKSTLAKQIQQRTKLPLFHLDQLYWKANWEETPEEEWIPKAQEVVDKEEWIIDGNYSGTMDMRLERADTIIFLDRSRWLCLYRVFKRIILNYGRTRADMAEGCKERFNWEFIVYVFHFNDVKRPKIIRRLKGGLKNKKVYVFKKDREVETFLKELE